MTKKVKSHPNITVHHEEVTEIPTEGTVIFASGPLTSEALGDKIKALTGETGFYFYDAAAPIVTAESLNYDKVFLLLLVMTKAMRIILTAYDRRGI